MQEGGKSAFQTEKEGSSSCLHDRFNCEGGGFYAVGKSVICGRDRVSRHPNRCYDGKGVVSIINLKLISENGDVKFKAYGEEIMACIILKEEGSVTIEEMSNYIKASMARHKVPKYIEFVDSFPMNAAGKVLKYKMRQDAAERLGLVGDGSDTASPGKS